MNKLLNLILALILLMGCEELVIRNENEEKSPIQVVIPKDSLNSQIKSAKAWMENTSTLETKWPLDFYQWDHSKALNFQLQIPPVSGKIYPVILLMDSISAQSVSVDRAFDLMIEFCKGGVSSLAGHVISLNSSGAFQLSLGHQASLGDFRPCDPNSANGLLVPYKASNASARVSTSQEILRGRTYSWVVFAYDSSFKVVYSSPLRYLKIK